MIWADIEALYKKEELMLSIVYSKLSMNLTDLQ